MDAIEQESPGTFEHELKFAIEPADAAKLAQLPLLAAVQPKIMNLVSTYYDTPAHVLEKAGLSLRVRLSDGRAVQTLKLAARPAGLFSRQEYETELAKAEPDLDHLRRYLPASQCKEPGKALAALGPVFRVEVRRTEWAIAWKDTAISVALDEGFIRAGDRSEPVSEVEIELVRGRILHVFELARQFVHVLPLRLEAASKAERGYRLTEGGVPRAQKSGETKLDRHATAAAGFQAIARLCIHHFALNEAVFLKTKAPEALHQMRVAARKLRSLMFFFEEMLSTREFGILQREVARVFKKLGAARDLDVLLGSLEKSRGEACPASLLDEIRAARDAAYARVLSMLRSRRFCRDVLDLLAFVERGEWSKAGRAMRATQKLNVSAAQILKLQRKNLRKFARVPDLKAKKRHKLRIEAKKFRYACEFFGDLFTRPKARLRFEDSSKMAEELQDTLGQLHDRVFMQDLLARWTGGDGKSGALRQSDDEIDEHRLIRAAEAARLRLDRQKRFWS